MTPMRHLALTAGPFRVALPLTSIRQLLDVGGERSFAPTEPRALGVAPIALARLLGERQTTPRPALLLLDGHAGPVLLTACSFDGIFEAGALSPLPPTVAVRWPDLIQGTVRSDGVLRLALDPHVLMGVIEVRAAELSEDDEARALAKDAAP